LDQIAKGDYANVIEPNLGFVGSTRRKKRQICDRDQKRASEASGFLKKPARYFKNHVGGFSMTSDLEKAMRWAHEANIQRYRKILSTPLTETERQFIQNRITEEQRAIEQFGSERGLKVAVTGDSV
jgi:hypothetical protein